MAPPNWDFERPLAAALLTPMVAPIWLARRTLRSLRLTLPAGSLRTRLHLGRCPLRPLSRGNLVVSGQVRRSSSSARPRPALTYALLSTATCWYACSHWPSAAGQYSKRCPGNGPQFGCSRSSADAPAAPAQPLPDSR
jgi:hypothetical protein